MGEESENAHMKLTAQQRLDKRAREFRWIAIGARRKLKAAGEAVDGEAPYAFLAETAFRAGYAFALRQLASEADSGNLLLKLGKKFPYGLPGEKEEEPCNSER